MRWIPVTLALLFAPAAGCRQGDAGPLPPDELEKVRAVGRAYQEAVNAEDVDAIVALFTEDALSFPPGWEPLRGTEAIRRFWEGQVTGVNGTGTPTEIALYGEGGVAYDVGTYIYTFTDTAGVTHTGHGKYVGIFRKQPDGSWKIAADIWNLNPPPPAVRPDTAP